MPWSLINIHGDGIIQSYYFNYAAMLNPLWSSLDLFNVIKGVYHNEMMLEFSVFNPE